MKTGAENISLRAATDGGAVLRLGAKNPASLRRHLINGYSDGLVKPLIQNLLQDLMAEVLIVGNLSMVA